MILLNHIAVILHSHLTERLGTKSDTGQPLFNFNNYGLS